MAACGGSSLSFCAPHQPVHISQCHPCRKAGNWHLCNLTCSFLSRHHVLVFCKFRFLGANFLKLAFWGHHIFKLFGILPSLTSDRIPARFPHRNWRQEVFEIQREGIKKECVGSFRHTCTNSIDSMPHTQNKEKNAPFAIQRLGISNTSLRVQSIQ